MIAGGNIGGKFPKGVLVFVGLIGIPRLYWKSHLLAWTVLPRYPPQKLAHRAEHLAQGAPAPGGQLR